MFNRTTSTKFFTPRRQDRKDLIFAFYLGALCAFARDGSYPIPDSHRAKTPRSQRSYFRFLSWCPLRLCESHYLSDSLNPISTENSKYVCLDPIIALFSWASTCTRGVLQTATGVAQRGLERPDKEVYTIVGRFCEYGLSNIILRRRVSVRL